MGEARCHSFRPTNDEARGRESKNKIKKTVGRLVLVGKGKLGPGHHWPIFFGKTLHIPPNWTTQELHVRFRALPTLAKIGSFFEGYSLWPILERFGRHPSPPPRRSSLDPKLTNPCHRPWERHDVTVFGPQTTRQGGARAKTK